jgi:hypothetical protein
MLMITVKFILSRIYLTAHDVSKRVYRVLVLDVKNSAINAGVVSMN